MLNSDEDEILNALKNKSTKKFISFQAQIPIECKFPLINLSFMSRTKFKFSRVEHVMFFITSGPDSKKVPNYCWTDRESVPVGGWPNPDLDLQSSEPLPSICNHLTTALLS